MRPVTFTVAGEPVPQPRPRVSTRGGFARAYVPSTHPVHAYRAAIAEEAARAGLEETGEPVEVIVDAVFARPKSHMTRKGVKATAPQLPRPDVDNVGKAVLDALQDVMGDDTNVRRLVVEKSYGPEARTTVRIQ
jgi:Holliday junction resolvase RusA-like endonuclease